MCVGPSVSLSLCVQSCALQANISLTNADSSNMALPSSKDVDALVGDLAEVAKGYSDSPDLNGHTSRVKIVAKAKELVRALITPEQMAFYHAFMVSGCDLWRFGV